MRAAIALTVALALCLSSLPALALDKQCFTVANRTASKIRAFNKSGDRTYGVAKEYSLAKMCCTPVAEKLCFEKSDGSSKIKIARISPDGLQEFSGPSCYKIYIKPGEIISVSLDPDRVHIMCETVKSLDQVERVPEFEALDANKDGQLDEKEVRASDILSYEYEHADQDGDKIINKREYDGALQKVNIFRGVEF